MSQPPAPQVWPTLHARDAPALIRFLVEAFGFIEVVVYGDGEVIEHAQLAWPEGGGVMLGSEPQARRKAPDDGGPRITPPGSFSAYVVTADPKAVHDRAVAAGGTVAIGLHETDYGSRDFSVTDPEGNWWSFGNYPGAPLPAP